jgi:hypothetical protein
MNKIFGLLVCTLFLTSCTVYTEKQSEALSQSVYATKDSINEARIDLADKYSEQASRIVKPPKKRINIQGIYKTTEHFNESVSNSNNKIVSRDRVVIVPEKFKNQTVIVVSSQEYQQLLKDKDVFVQLQKDHSNLQEHVKNVDEELTKQENYNNKMIQDLNRMQKQLVEKDLAILKRNILIVVLILTIGGGVYLRMKGVL